MEKIDLTTLKELELNILKDIHKFCQEKNIKYSIAYGTMLGAIRHKGFIPWDDDVDIIMTRENYEKFCQEYLNQKYELVTYKTKNYGYMFAKVIDSSTIVYEKHNKSVPNLGVYVDIFPVDYASDTYSKALKAIKRSSLTKYLLVAWNWKHFYLNKNRSYKRQIARFLLFLLSRFFSKDFLVKRLNKRISKIKTYHNYSACWFGPYGLKEIMETSVFSEYIDIKFEDTFVSCLKNYDIFLTTIYGDYMTPPPIDKQVETHTFDAFFK